MEIVFNLQNISLRLGVTKFPMFEQIAMKHRTSTIFKATLATPVAQTKCKWKLRSAGLKVLSNLIT